MFIKNMDGDSWYRNVEYCVLGVEQFKGEERILNEIAKKMNILELQHTTRFVITLKEEKYYYVVYVNNVPSMAFNKKEKGVYSNNYIGFISLRKNNNKADALLILLNLLVIKSQNL